MRDCSMLDVAFVQGRGARSLETLPLDPIASSFVLLKPSLWLLHLGSRDVFDSKTCHVSPG